MLIGLYETRTASGMGENALFKWSSSANDLVRPVHDRIPVIVPRASYGG